jgi:hypothetical protein
MLPHILLPNLPTLSDACPWWKKCNRPHLNCAATHWRAVLKAPLAALLAGVLANLGVCRTFIRYVLSSRAKGATW